MLTKQNNPLLFFCAVSALNKALPKSQHLDANTAMFLTSEQLKSIKHLELEKCPFPFSGLDGIENFAGLESLIINGQNDVAKYIKMTQTLQKWQLFGATSQQKLVDLDSLKTEYGALQLSNQDFKKIATLKNLQKLHLNNQIQLTNVDFSTLPMLYDVSMANCGNLEKVQGLDRLLCFACPKEHNYKFADVFANFEFSGCDLLREIGGLEKICVETGGAGKVAFFPTTTYAYMCKKHPNLVKLLSENKNIAWTDISSNVRYETNSAQMEMVINRVDEIVQTVCQNQTTDLAKISAVYRWICDNVMYDFDNLEYQKTHMEEIAGQNQERIEKGKHENLLLDKLASTYCALWSKRAICTGVGNLLNFFLADMGYVVRVCKCSVKPNNQSQNLPYPLVVTTHQISKVYIQNNGEEYAYYCDPTWDLGKPCSNNFMMNKTEIEEKHNLTLDDENEAVGPSIQQQITTQGLDVSRTPKPKVTNSFLEYLYREDPRAK